MFLRENSFCLKHTSGRGDKRGNIVGVHILMLNSSLVQPKDGAVLSLTISVTGVFKSLTSCLWFYSFVFTFFIYKLSHSFAF